MNTRSLYHSELKHNRLGFKDKETETGASKMAGSIIFSDADKQKSTNPSHNKTATKIQESIQEIPDKFESLETYHELAREFLICASLCHECLVEKVKVKKKGRSEQLEGGGGEQKFVKRFQGSSPDEIAICSGAKKIGVEFLGNQLGISRVDFLGEEMKFEVKIVKKFKTQFFKFFPIFQKFSFFSIFQNFVFVKILIILKVFEFDSERKRQSVIIFDGKNYKLYVKGADSSILPYLSEDYYHPYYKSIDSNLTKFSLIGFRTLVFACRYLTQSEFESINKSHQEILNSTSRKRDMKLLAKSVETDLTLLGMTAVEDSLQVNVNEAVSRLLEADIKVWMITGDKLETAENIGLMAGIVSHEMKKFYIKNVNNSNFKDFARMMKIDLVQAEEEKRAVIFDMRSVGEFLVNFCSFLKIFRISIFMNF